MTYKEISIVIPVYNEAENIGSAIHEIQDKIRIPANILIIFDFDEDNTLSVVKKLLKKNSRIQLVKNRLGSGVLNAIKTGFAAVEDGIILVTMADLSDDLSKVDEMVKKMNEGYDLVCGSRYMKGGRQVGGPWLKKILSRLAGISLHYLIRVPTHDITNSFKMYSKNLLDDIQIESQGGFELGMEIVIKSFYKGYRITEVPTTWYDSEAGESRFRLFKWLPKYFYWYIFALYHKIKLVTFKKRTDSHFLLL